MSLWTRILPVDLRPNARSVGPSGVEPAVSGRLPYPPRRQPSSRIASPALRSCPSTYEQKDVESATPSNFPFNFTHIFTAALDTGARYGPVAIPVGSLFNEPITGGTLVGTGINAINQGGFAHHFLYDNLSDEVTSIDLYGMTDDGFAFYIRESGVGPSASRVTRVKMKTGETNSTKY
ncbi:hypothetical protein BDZ45DRAFT_741639 [Acephala macrosclerotiorum]|nr:hypothetical protein BDZ45DRAFT_741639 [Acephala macrosclerotiorum]